jgi:hypothetical protein
LTGPLRRFAVRRGSGAEGFELGRGRMNDDEPIAIELEDLRAEHRRLDAEIAALIAAGATDQLELARLKRTKLRLKDRIQQLSDLNTPDIIA